jgi:hypothetical protein
MAGAASKIIVQGEAGEYRANAFPDFALSPASGQTGFCVPDQTQLQHVLDQLFRPRDDDRQH